MGEYAKFGDFLSAKRRQKGISSLEMSIRIGISPGYYCDIEKNRKKYTPERELLDKILKELNLSEKDKLIFFDLAAGVSSQVSLDLPEYIMGNEVVRAALRLAKDKADTDDWNQFIEKLKSKE